MRGAVLVILLHVGAFLNAQIKYSVDNPKIAKWYIRANLLIKQRAFDEGIAVLEKCLKKAPNFIEAHWTLANTYHYLGQLDSSFSHYDNYWMIADHQTVDQAKARILAQKYFSRGLYVKAGQCIDQVRSVNQLGDLKDDLLAMSIDFSLSHQASEGEHIPLVLDANVNHFKHQYFPSLTIDKKSLIFTKRDGSSGNDDEDLVISKYVDGAWTVAQSLSDLVNSNSNEGAASISADGRTLIYTICEDRKTFGSCDLFITKKIGDQWIKPQNLGQTLNSKKWDAQPSVSADGNTLYFSSNRPGGYGKRDLWYSNYEDDVWSTPQNLGPLFNTSEDDVTPFIHVNGETLFFASNGRVGFGGFDLFVTERSHGNWTEPRNLGNAINNHLDQLSFVVTADGKEAYFSQEHELIKGQASSQIVVLPIDNDTLFDRTSSYILGKVTDAQTGHYLKARIELFDLSTNEKSYHTYSDSLSGEYFFAVNEGSRYGVYATAPGYLFEDFRFDLKKRDFLMPDTLDIELTPAVAGASLTLDNIYFELDSDKLSEDSQSALKIIVQFLEKSELKVLIEGHTDQLGSKAYNQDLSERRAKTVFDFLILTGIKPAQLEYQGFGASQPLYSAPSALSRNRRIEFRIR